MRHAAFIGTIRCRTPIGSEKICEVQLIVRTLGAKVVRRICLFLIVLTSASGCTFTRDGIFIGRVTADTAEKDAAMVAQLRANALAQRCASEGRPESFEPTIVLVGETGVLRNLTPAVYDDYKEAAAFFHTATSAAYVTSEAFKETFSGWTMLTVSNNLAHRRAILTPVFVPTNLGNVTFGAMFFGNPTGDLVAAKNNADGAYVVDRVLCFRGPDYRQCDSQYRRGAFDGTTGQQIDEDAKPIDSGKRIDPTSYKPVDGSVGCSEEATTGDAVNAAKS
jgi:hypothetical protein